MALTSTITDRQNAAVGLGFVAGHPTNIFVLELLPKNLTTDAITTLYFSDQGETTSTTDTPANILLQSRFLVVPNITTTLVDQAGASDREETQTLPGLRNFARPEVSEAKIINVDTDPDTGAGPLDAYLDPTLWSFDGRKAFLKVGASDLAYTAYETWYELRIDGEPTWDSKGNLVFRFEAPMARFNQPFNRNRYGGWGAALVLDGATTSVNFGNEWNIGLQDTTFQFYCSWDNLAAIQSWFRKRATLTGATDAGCSFYVNASDQLIFSVSDGTNSGSINMGAAGAYGDETRRLFTITIKKGGNITAWVTVKDSDGEPSSTNLGTLDISTWGSIQNAENCVMGSNPAVSANFVDGTIAEFRVWRTVLTQKQIDNTALYSLSGSENYLVGLYKFNDRTKTTKAYQEVVTTGLDSILYAGALHTVDYGVNYEKGAAADFTVGVWFKTTNTIAGDSFIFGNRDGTAAADSGYQIHIDSSGDVHSSACDGVAAVTASTTSAAYADATWHFAALRVNQTANTIEVLALKTRSDSTFETASADITALGALTSGNNLTAGQADDASHTFAGYTAHHFNVNIAATDAQILAMARYLYDTDNISGPENSVSAKNASSSFWNTNTGSGATVTDDWSSIDGTISGASWATQDATMTGTVTWVSTYEGDASIFDATVNRDSQDTLQGREKPQTWGRVQSFPLEVVDLDDADATSTPIHHVADPEWGEINAVEAVFSEGLKLTLTTDYTVDLPNNAVTLVAPQDGIVTANVKGYEDGAGDLIETTADIASAIFTDLGETSQNAASFAALNNSFPYQIGLGVTGEPHLGHEVLDALFRSSCFAYKNVAGEIVVGLYQSQDGAAADLALTASRVKRNGITVLREIPTYTAVELLYRRNWVTLNSFLPATDPPEQERQRRQFRRVNAPASGVTADYIGSSKLEVASLIHRKRDAQTEADRLIAIYSVPRRIIRVQIVADLFKAEIGDTVKLTHPRYGYSAGKNWLCVGTSYPKNPSLDLFGPFSL